MAAEARWAAKLLVIASLSMLVVKLDVVARLEGPVPLTGSVRLPKFSLLRAPGLVDEMGERALRPDRMPALASLTMSAGVRRRREMGDWRLAANDRSMENLPRGASP